MVKLAVLTAVSATFNVLVETVNVVARLLASCSAVESSETLIAGSVIVASVLHEKLKRDTRIIVVNKRNLFILFFVLKNSEADSKKWKNALLFCLSQSNGQNRSELWSCFV